MAKYEKMINGNFDTVVSQIHTYIMNSAMSIELIDEAEYEMQGIRVAVKVYDKYYMRSSNRASLTVTMIGNGSDIQVCAIGAAGSTGVLFNFSWGAEEDFISVVAQALNEIE